MPETLPPVTEPSLPKQAKTKIGDDSLKPGILYLVPSLGIGGAEIQLLSLLKGLNKEKYRIAVAVFYGGGALEGQFKALRNVRLFHLGKKHAWHFGHLLALSRILRQEEFAIIQPYNVSARLIGIMAAKLYRIPYTVVMERNAKEVYSSIGSRLYHMLERWAIRKAHLLVTNSEAGRQFCEARGVSARRIEVIYNGIDPARLAIKRSRKEIRAKYRIGEECFVVGMVARMFPQKDHRTFLHAARIVAKERPDVRFVLVGDGPDFEVVQSVAKEQGLDQQVIFTGKVENVADYLNAMDLVLLTSKTSEGCSNALIEAMALGKAVVATRVVGNIELIQDGVTGRLVEPQNPTELAAVILDLQSKREKLRALGEAAKSMALTRFSYRAMVKSYEKTYEKLLGMNVGALRP